MALFNGAKSVVVHGGSFTANAGHSPQDGLDKLVAEVAPNAILNAGGRADEVRCFPGTREEVIKRLEKFMDGESPGQKRMMWLSGPAGAGKSAILQTVAERRSDCERYAANFFFFRGDGTRSHSKPLVATLVYQLRRFYPALDEPLSDWLKADPLICSSSIEEQFKQLIAYPIRKIQQSTPIQHPIVIIIDGLDECHDKKDQDQILVALHALAHADDSPFLILVSSRTEPQLVMSFNRLGSSVGSIFLNEDYKPQKDIRLFVVAKFAEIKKDHHLARTLSEAWPTEADINTIINKSSGQFVYAVTVMRYIQFSSSSPALSLITILEMRPSTDHNPLAHLDAVYSHIFSKVPNTRVVKLILFARKCSKSFAGSASGPIIRLAGYTDIVVESIFADLAAIIQVVHRSGVPSYGVNESGDLLEFYHASLEDYLNDKSRSTVYYVNEDDIAAELSSMCLRNIHNADSIELAMKPLRWVQEPTPELSQSLLGASTKHLSDKNHIHSLGSLIGHIERLYWKRDKTQFKVLLQSWSRFVYINNTDVFFWQGMRSENQSASLYYEQYWMTEGYGGQELLTPPNSAPTGRTNSETRISSTGTSARNTLAVPPKNPSPIQLIERERDHIDLYGNNTPPVLMSSVAPDPAFATSFHADGDRVGTVGTWAYSNADPNYGITYGSAYGDSNSEYLPSSYPRNEWEFHRPMSTGTAQQWATIASPARSNSFFSLIHKLFRSPRPNITRRPPRGISSAIGTYNWGQEGPGNREFYHSLQKLNMIRVKLHYQGDIRGMTLTPETPFSEFVEKITLKFGKNFDNLIMKYKDEDGSKITLRDYSDFEHAIETVRQSSNGAAEGKLEIWCKNGVR